jgi:hypothetical protein
MEQDGNHQGPIDSTSGQVAFQLVGGLYQIAAVATWGGGSATLEQKGPDDTTWLTAATALSANGIATYNLPMGIYRWTIATATAVYVSVARIPVG